MQACREESLHELMKIKKGSMMDDASLDLYSLLRIVGHIACFYVVIKSEKRDINLF